MKAAAQISANNRDQNPGFKVIYGIESYMINDTAPIFTGKVDTPFDGEFKIIRFDELQAFHDHAFKPYVGRKLDALVQSIRENGIVQPIIVRPVKDNDIYEIVSGHNRVEAAKQAELPSIPALVRELTDEAAVLLANETNMTQRSFKDWLPSERTKSIYQYHQAIKKQGSRTDLKESTSGEKHQKSDDHARAKTAKAYGLKENVIRLYLELYHLSDKLMERLDNGEFGTTPAQNLSHISPDGQALVDSVLDADREICKVTVANSISVRGELKDYTSKKIKKEEKESATEKVRELLNINTIFADEVTEKFKVIKVETDEYERLFPNKTTDEALDEIIVAVNFYHESVYRKATQTDEAVDMEEKNRQPE